MMSKLSKQVIWGYVEKESSLGQADWITEKLDKQCELVIS